MTVHHRSARPGMVLDRRRFLAAGAATLGLGALAACGGGQGTGSGGDVRVWLQTLKSADFTDPVTNEKRSGLNNLIQSDVPESLRGRIKLQDIAATDATQTVSKIQSLLLAGSADVIHGFTVYQFFDQGLLVDLQDRYTKDNWQANFVDNLFTPPTERVLLPAWSSSPTGRVSSPSYVDTVSQAYDAQLFEDFGVEALAKKPTMDEILEKAKKLTGKNPRTGQQCYGLFFNPKVSAHHMVHWLGNGLDYGRLDPADPSAINFRSDELRSAIEAMIGAAASCPPGFEVGQGQEKWGSENNDVAILMSVNPAGMLPTVAKKLTDRFVVTEGVRDRWGKNPYIGSGEFAISAKAADPDAAWETVKFLSGAVGQRFMFEQLGVLPSWKTADWVSDDVNPYAKTFLTVAREAQNHYLPLFMFQTFRPWMAQIVTTALNGGEIDLAAGLEDMQQKAEAWAAQQKTPQG